MKKILHKIAFICFFSLCLCSVAQTPLAAGLEADLRQGYEAFRKEDWTAASLFLKKAVSSSGNVSDENHFMLIKSEIYSGEYAMAQQDCVKFLDKYPLSVYSPYVQYQNGRMLHLLGKNEDAILALSDFCHNYYDDELYPLALYWIAEAFFDEYDFESAKGLYERLVHDFPDCEKTTDAQYKIDLIEQRGREEKLLYLLKVIGEENLSTREEYERQIRIYEMEDKLGLNREVVELQVRIEELENELASRPSSGAVPADNPEPVKTAVVQSQPSQGSIGSGGGSGGAGSGSGGSGSGSGGNSGESSGASDSGMPSETTPAPVLKKPATVQVVNEPSLHLKKNGRTAVGSSVQRKDVNKDVEALKNKAKQLRYLLEDQSADGGK